MSAGEHAEHVGYLNDAVKLTAYEQALGAVIEPGVSTVLDLGAGTGILGLLAARRGARHVYAVDAGPIVEAAAQVAARSGQSDRVTHLRGRSTEIELPERVDVAVCDQIGGFVHDAGVLGYFADARERLLRDSGVLVPAGFRLLVAPARCDKVRALIDTYAASPAGFDFEPFRELAVNTEHYVDADEVELLGPGVEVASIAADDTSPIIGGGTSRVTVMGECDGLVGYFEADLGGGATLTNDPSALVRMKRWCNLYPISQRRSVQPGDRLELKVDVRPSFKAVTWSVTVKAGSGDVGPRERHSTLLGAFLDRADLERRRGAPVVATSLGQAIQRAISLADGTLSTDAIVELVLQDLGHAGSDMGLAESVRDVLSIYTAVEGSVIASATTAPNNAEGASPST